MDNRKYYTTENPLQEPSLIEQISILTKLATTELEKVTSKIKESISLVQNVADSLSGESKAKLNEAIFLANTAIEIISSKNNMHSTDIEKTEKSFDSEVCHIIKETSIVQPHLPEKRIIHSPRATKTPVFVKEYRENELKIILYRAEKDWNFDVFFLKSISNDKPIQIFGCYYIKKYGLSEILNIPEPIYRSFFEALEKCYNNNPFHNAAHASDVLHSTMYFYRNSILSDYFHMIDMLSLIIACLGHDVGHPGYTNRFLIDNNDELAILYNDFSVLEMMHCSTIFQLLNQSNTNILSTLLCPGEYISIRKVIIEMILATDMSKHFEVLYQFRAKLINSPKDALEDSENRLNIMKIMIKCADIGYTAKQKEIDEKWSLLLTEEHFNQGDMQKLKNQRVSMYCDRDTTDIVKSQVDFLKNIALPLYEDFNQFLKSSVIGLNCVDQLKANIKSWENIPGKRNKSQIVNKKDISSVNNYFIKKWKPRRRSLILQMQKQ